MKLMVEKHQKFQNFLTEKTLKASAKPTTTNCNHSKLIQEIKRLIFKEKFKTNTIRPSTRTHVIISVKKQEQRAQ